jgi:hypothetical protein
MMNDECGMMKGGARQVMVEPAIPRKENDEGKRGRDRASKQIARSRAEPWNEKKGE